MQKSKIEFFLLDKEKLSKFGSQQLLKNLGQLQEKNQTFTDQVLNGKNNLTTKRGIDDN